ncbi:ring-1,2-phenylacetyl-CoA epoxidase subunit PaaE [Algoriphagus ornithinivorans]|uniref:Ring-1,2-phenylacetyl-CoA epoxidase subunit PaaE n=1 Tax=Algoriphagus ornithinivorans TaxID=226506 RepID=A0A1I5AZF3_9BACT|nr:ferredoxin--NADP reductase [Algoriphagus ornithinivorans]SFN67835.1 ring-1,2-phenylacetyl-CoA epoxidase subunit PaaE [Algoriphagus ornithinivorans]
MFNLFKKKKEEVKKSNYLPLKVREVVRETPDTVSIYFEQPEPFLDYKPGQFLTLVMDFDGKEQRRSYSLCTSPFVDPFPGISVKRVEGGLFSNYLNEKVNPGKTINVLKPLGNFTTDFHSKNQRHFIMVAGGSGITPIMGILKSVLVNEPNSIITLIYCSRSEEQIIFKRQLDLLEKANPDRLKVIHNLSQPSEDWKGPKGRLNRDSFKEFVSQAEYEQRYEEIYFLCGPDGIMDTAENVLEELGIPEERIHRESFFSAAAQQAHDNAMAGINSGILTRDVKIMLEGEEFDVTVNPEQTVLEAGLEQGLNMPYSCQSGLCTACRGRLLSGKVKMDEDAGLSEKEIAAGYVLCCVSRPLTDDIKITIE